MTLSEDKIVISDNLYNTELQKVMKLPEKKRKNYKHFLIDINGQKTKLIWKDGKLRIILRFLKYILK